MYLLNFLKRCIQDEQLQDTEVRTREPPFDDFFAESPTTSSSFVLNRKKSVETKQEEDLGNESEMKKAENEEKLKVTSGKDEDAGEMKPEDKEKKELKNGSEEERKQIHLERTCFYFYQNFLIFFIKF